MPKTKTEISICQSVNKPLIWTSQITNTENTSQTCPTRKQNGRSCHSADLATPFSKTSSIPSFTPMNQFSQFWPTGRKQPTLLTKESKFVSSKTWKIIGWMNRFITNINYRVTLSKSKNLFNTQQQHRRATAAKKLICSGSSKPRRAQMSQVAPRFYPNKTWLLRLKMISKNSLIPKQRRNRGNWEACSRKSPRRSLSKKSKWSRLRKKPKELWHWLKRPLLWANLKGKKAIC